MPKRKRKKSLRRRRNNNEPVQSTEIFNYNTQTLYETSFNRTHCLIFGFNREMQHKLFPNNLFIPDDIIQICFRFYFENSIIFITNQNNKQKNTLCRIYFFSSKLNYITHPVYINFSPSHPVYKMTTDKTQNSSIKNIFDILPKSYQMCRTFSNNKHLLYLDICIPKKWSYLYTISFHYVLGNDIMQITTVSSNIPTSQTTCAMYYDQQQTVEHITKAKTNILNHLLKDYNNYNERKYLKSLIKSLTNINELKPTSSDCTTFYRKHIKLVQNEPTIQNIDKLLSLKLTTKNFYTKTQSLYYIIRACVQNNSKLLRKNSENTKFCVGFYDLYYKELIERLEDIEKYKNSMFDTFNSDRLYLFPVYNFFVYLQFVKYGKFKDDFGWDKLLMDIDINEETYNIEKCLIEILNVDLLNEQFHNRICPLEPMIPTFLCTIKKNCVRKLYEIFSQLSKQKYCESIFEIIINSMHSNCDLFYCLDLNLRVVCENKYIENMLRNKWKEMVQFIENSKQLLRLFGALVKCRDMLPVICEMKSNTNIEMKENEFDDIKIEMCKEIKSEQSGIKDCLNRYLILFESLIKQYNEINYMCAFYLTLQNEINRLIYDNCIDIEMGYMCPEQLLRKQMIFNYVYEIIRYMCVYIRRVFLQKRKISNAIMERSMVIGDEKQNKFRIKKELICYRKLLKQCNEMIKLFQLFQINVIREIGLRDEWKEIEKHWMNWNVKDIICWIRSKLKWFNDKQLPNDINLNKIEQNMISCKINGKCLQKMDEIDLFSYGFAKQYVAKIFSFIYGLCYKKSKHGNKSLSMVIYSGMTDIPLKYKCKLTNKIMSNPVIGIDNETYEKKEIIKYFKKYKKSPITNECFEVMLTNKNDCNLMIFDDMKLKEEIEEFKQKYLVQTTVYFE